MHDRRFSVLHFVFESLRFLPNLVVLRADGFQIAVNPRSRVDLRLVGNVEQLRLLFIPEFLQISFGLEHFLEITIFDCLLLNIDFHFSEFAQFLLELLSKGVLFGVLRLELSQSLMRFFKGFGNISILLLTHANGLILLGQ